MNKIQKSRIVAGLFVLAACLPVIAQTNAPPPLSPPSPVTAPTTSWITLNPALQASNLVAVDGPDYAPSLSHKWGVTGAVLYPIANTAAGAFLTGYREDYIDKATANGTASATFQMPVTLWGFLNLIPDTSAGVQYVTSGKYKGNVGATLGADLTLKVLNVGSGGKYGAVYVTGGYEDDTALHNASVYHGFADYSAPLEPLMRFLFSWLPSN